MHCTATSYASNTMNDDGYFTTPGHTESEAVGEFLKVLTFVSSLPPVLDQSSLHSVMVPSSDPAAN